MRPKGRRTGVCVPHAADDITISGNYVFCQMKRHRHWTQLLFILTISVHSHVPSIASALRHMTIDRMACNVWPHVVSAEAITAAHVCSEHNAVLQHRLLSLLGALPGARTFSPSNCCRSFQWAEGCKCSPFPTSRGWKKRPVCMRCISAVSGQLFRSFTGLKKKAQDWRYAG